MYSLEFLFSIENKVKITVYMVAEEESEEATNITTRYISLLNEYII